MNNKRAAGNSVFAIRDKNYLLNLIVKKKMNGLLVSEGIVHSFSDLRSSIFSTDTPGKQGPSTAGRRRDDTLWTNQSNVDVDDTNNEGRW